MTAPELKRYNLTTEVSPRGAFYGDMTENASGEYVLYSDVEAYTQTAMRLIGESEVMKCVEIVDEHFDSALAALARAALTGEKGE